VNPVWQDKLGIILSQAVSKVKRIPSGYASD